MRIMRVRYQHDVGSAVSIDGSIEAQSRITLTAEVSNSQYHVHKDRK